MMLALAWLVGFVMCQACLLHRPLWWGGLAVFVIVACITKAYRTDREGIMLLICYGLMWPFFSPILGYRRLQCKRVRTIKPQDLKPFKLEL